MRPASSGEILTAMVEMFTSGDIAGVGAVVHPEYLDHQGLRGEPVHGPAGFADVVTVARSGYDELDVTVEDLIEQGSRSAARLHWRGTRASGDVVERETIEIIHVQDGLALEHWGAR